MLDKFRISCAALSGRIYLGKINKAGDSFLAGKKDVTGECVNAVCEHAIDKGGVIELECNGKKVYEITVKKL